ncbi:hypothetical protein D3C83_216860 [compost metagenome]
MAASIHEFATLFPSPMKATTALSKSMPHSRIVRRSARIWQGWSQSVSPLMTGTVACRARSTTIWWRNVRIMIPST